MPAVGYSSLRDLTPALDYLTAAEAVTVRTGSCSRCGQKTDVLTVAEEGLRGRSRRQLGTVVAEPYRSASDGTICGPQVNGFPDVGQQARDMRYRYAD